MDGSPYSTSLVELVEFIGVVEYIIRAGCDYMTEKRFIEFMTQNSDDGELNCGVYDIIEKKSYHTTDSKNAKEIADLLNALHDENMQLKQQKDKWKQQCIHFKEMLDDMDIAYLCDEWIYEELKGDVE